LERFLRPVLDVLLYLPKGDGRQQELHHPGLNEPHEALDVRGAKVVLVLVENLRVKKDIRCLSLVWHGTSPVRCRTYIQTRHATAQFGSCAGHVLGASPFFTKAFTHLCPLCSGRTSSVCQTQTSVSEGWPMTISLNLSSVQSLKSRPSRTS